MGTVSDKLRVMQPIERGTLISEPGFHVPLEAEVRYGNDYVRVEAAQSHVRINVKAILEYVVSG